MRIQRSAQGPGHVSIFYSDWDAASLRRCANGQLVCGQEGLWALSFKALQCKRDNSLKWWVGSNSVVRSSKVRRACASNGLCRGELPWACRGGLWWSAWSQHGAMGLWSTHSFRRWPPLQTLSDILHLLSLIPAWRIKLHVKNYIVKAGWEEMNLSSLIQLIQNK